MSISIGTVTITRNPSFGTDWSKDRLNQYTQGTADGGRNTYDNGPNILKGTIVLRNVSKANGDALRTYLTDTAIFGKNSFTITPPASTDLGSGVGTAVTLAFYDGGTNLDGVFEYIAPGIYNINLSYWKRLT